MTTNIEIFEGIMKLRLSWIIDVMKKELVSSGVDSIDIYSLSPNAFKQLLFYILSCNTNDERTTYQKRQLDGALNRVPENFYNKSWLLLKKSPFGIKIYDYHLPQQPTISDMTDYELNFSIKIEEMLSIVDEPVFRQIMVETIIIIYTILCRNPELQFNQVIDLDGIVNQAFEMYLVDTNKNEIEKENNEMNDRKCKREAFFNEKNTASYLSRACIESLLKSSEYSLDPMESVCKIT